MNIKRKKNGDFVFTMTEQEATIVGHAFNFAPLCDALDEVFGKENTDKLEPETFESAGIRVSDFNMALATAFKNTRWFKVSTK